MFLEIYIMRICNFSTCSDVFAHHIYTNTGYSSILDKFNPPGWMSNHYGWCWACDALCRQEPVNIIATRAAYGNSHLSRPHTMNAPLSITCCIFGHTERWTYSWIWLSSAHSTGIAMKLLLPWLSKTLSSTHTLTSYSPLSGQLLLPAGYPMPRFESVLSLRALMSQQRTYINLQYTKYIMIS